MTTNSAKLMPEGRQRYFNNDGAPCAGGLLYTYAAGTTLPKMTYADPEATVPNPNPLPLDAKGEAVVYWIGAYKVDLKQADGTQVTGYPVDGYDTEDGERPVQVEVQAGAVGQTVFNLAALTYTPGIGSLRVFVDGFRLYPADYLETNNKRVTLKTALARAADVLFEAGAAVNNSVAYDASTVPFYPSGTGATQRSVQDKERDVLSVRDFTGSGVDGVTSNQAGIAAAVAAAYAAGAELYWPAGTYVSTASIPNFHDVAHLGPGIVKRGTATFAVRPRGKSTKLNTLYVALTGAATNDGLTSAQPMASLQQAFDALANAGPTLAGIWQIQLDAGARVACATLDGVTSKNRINILGAPAAGDVPTTVFDGTGMAATSLTGIKLANGVYAYLKDIKFTNWTGGAGVGEGDASSALNVSQLCNVWADNVHADNCGTAIYFTKSRGYVGGGIISNCTDGVTAFGGSQVTNGYVTATTFNSCTNSAVYYRDGSNGTIENGLFNNNNIGVKLMHQAITRVSNSTFTGSSTADVYLYTGSSAYFGTGNTHTVGKKVKAQFALSLDAANQFYYDGDKDMFNFGVFATPSYKFHFRKVNTTTFASGSCTLAIEDSSPQIAMNGAASATFGFQCAVPGVSNVAAWQYLSSDHTWRMRINDTDTYRWAATYFRPIADNAASIGAAGFRWTAVYAVNVRLSPPASVTPTANGEMMFELTNDTTLKIKVKGSDGVVRSATLALA